VVLGFSDPIPADTRLDRPEPSSPSTIRSGGHVPSPVNVVITDGQTQFRAGLARLLAAETRLKVVSQTYDTTQNGDLDLQPLPDLAPFNPESSVVQILVLAADFGAGGDEAAGEAGRPHLGRDFTAEGIIARLLALYSAGTAVVSSRPEVSKRELVVLAQVAAGLSNKQIGRHLGISQKTVRNHLSRIFSKLGAGNRTEAVMNAMRLGLLSV